MNRQDTRAAFAENTNIRTPEPTRRTRSLLSLVGKALGLRSSGPAIENLGGKTFEPLEQRTMLEGSFATAIAINLNNSQVQGTGTGVINPSIASTDNDFFTFVAPNDEFLTVLADTANENGVNTLNNRITVFGSADNTDIIAQGSTNGTLSSGVQRDGWVGFQSQAGRRYYVVVSSDYGTGPGPNLTTGNSYTLRVDGLTNRFEIGQDTGIGREAGSQPPGNPNPPLRPILGNITLRQQDVVYRYIAPNTPGFNSLVTVNVQYTDYSPANLPGTSIPDRLDTRVEIYTTTGQLVTSDSDAGRVNDAFTSFFATAGETYYIRVRSDEVRPRDVNDNFFDLTLATGPFFLVLDARSTEVTIDSVTRRAAEIGSAFTAFGNPTVAPFPVIANPTFQTDSYNFTAQGDGLTIITASPAGLAPVTNPALRLYDDQGNLLAFNDNFAGLSAQISVRLVGGRQYFVVVDGFDVNSATQYTLNIESNHTNDTTTTLDDHINTPALATNPTSAQRNTARGSFEQATGLTWGQTNLSLDADGNPIRDRGVTVNATGTGRIQGQGDTDLFQFTPQVDQQLDYAGNNDDQGTSLYIGGRFNRSDPGSAYPTDSRNVTVWDAGDYFYAGGQSFDANAGVTFGFRDNPATAGTNSAEIYVEYDWLPAGFTGDLNHILVVGGDFELVIPGANGPVVATNLAIWAYNPTAGRWQWSAALGDADAPVRAVTAYDPPAPAGGGTDLGQQLIVAGDFTTIGGVAANRIAFRDVFNGFQAIGGGITNGSVNALAVYDPGDPGSGNPSGVPPIPDPEDPPLQLFIGGSFTGTGFQNLATTSSLTAIAPARFGNANAAITGNINGPVFALAVYSDPLGGATAGTRGDILFVGGQFTNAGGTAATNIAAFGIVPSATNGRPANVLGWSAVGTGVTGANSSVRALTVWDAPDINGSTITPTLVIGGLFQVQAANSANVQNNIVQWTGTAYNALIGAGNGTNAIVRALTTVVDAQEPSIEENLRTGNPQSVLYIGGDFTTVSNNVQAAPVQAARVAQFSAIRGQAADSFTWSRLNGGVGNVSNSTTPIATVFALTAFDDGNPAEWDRHDRPASRLGLSVSGTDGSFINAQVRIFDSNFNVVYGFDRPGSNTISPINPDPAGSIDPASSNPGRNTALDGITLWGGQVYYLEVSDLSGGGTGRYTISLTADGLPPDVNGDGTRDDINATYAIEPNEGDFSGSQQIQTTAFFGDGSNLVNAAGQPLAGTSTRTQRFNPSTGTRFITTSDLGNISTFDDTDLYSFRAEQSGFAEVRISTINVADQFGQWTESPAGVRTFVSGNNSTYDSPLDGVVRVFRNDFEQVGYNDDSGVVNGTRGAFTDPNSTDPAAPDLGTNVGSFTDVVFSRRDSRVVIPVIAGNTYFVQVESSQRYSNGAPGVAGNRTSTIARERDVRVATGAYRLYINAMPSLDTDVENGVPVQDDHADSIAGGRIFDAFATPIDIGDLSHGTNGAGSASGIINNTPLKATDFDLFTFIAPGDGDVLIRVTPATGSALTASFQLFNSDPNSASYGTVAANSAPIGGNGAQIQTRVSRGARFVIAVRGAGTTQGAYDINISGVPQVDDFADASKLWNAQDVTLRDFLGQGSLTGNINSAGDTDLFRFAFNDTFLSLTVNVSSTDATLRPAVTVYEINEDLSGNPVLLRVGFNDNAAGAASAQTTVPVTPNRTTLPASGPARTYPFYYVLVRGTDATADTGAYNLTLSFNATDDHADGDTNADGVLDTGEYSFASRILIDSTTGAGNNSGVIERSNDSDLFQFTAPASGPSSLIVARSGSSALRQRITLLDASGATISSVTSPDASSPTSQTITFEGVRDVTYYLVVQPFENPNSPNANTSTTGDYTVNVQTAPIDDYPNVGEFTLAAALQFNRTTGLAQIGGSAAGDSSNARISPSSDSDLFTFRPLLTGQQTISVTPFTTSLGTLTPRIRVFQEVGANFVELADVSASGAGQTVSFSLNATSTLTNYFVLVTVPGSATAPNTTGEYRVQVQGPVPTSETGGSDPAAIDFNAATSINLSTRNGEGERIDQLSPSGDRDVFTFTSLAAGQTFVQLVAPNGSLLRASIRVLNAANELQSSEVAFDSQGIPGAVANTSFTAAANTQYWVIVDGLGDSVGSYTLRVKVPTAIYQLVYPEGFANSNIAEFVSLVNPNATNATYSIFLRYEWGDTPQLLAAQGTIAANSRDGLTIQNRTNDRLPGLLADIPYSIVVESNVPLGATLAHYDLGGSLGDSFTSTGASEWTFARVERTAGVSNDFAVFYNLNTFDVDVTLTAYQNGQTFNVATQRVGGQRRGGWSINDTNLAGLLPRGIFSIKLTATPASSANNATFQGIVASLSHYTNDAAFGLLGDSNGGATTGIITNITQGPQVSSEVVLFNPGSTTATVSLTGTYVTGNLPNFSRQITIAPNSQTVINGSSLGLINDQAAGITWRANQRIVVNSNQTQLGDADSTQPATSAGTRFYFGDAFIDPAQAGRLYFENLFIANPTSSAQTISVRLVFIDATTSTFTVQVAANGFAQVRLHERPEVLNQVGSPWFALDITSPTPFIASLQHYDLSFGGGWATSGVPLGLTQDLNTIIS